MIWGDAGTNILTLREANLNLLSPIFKKLLKN